MALFSAFIVIPVCGENKLNRTSREVLADLVLSVRGCLWLFVK